MRNFGLRLRKLEQATEQVATAYLWRGYDTSEVATALLVTPPVIKPTSPSNARATVYIAQDHLNIQEAPAAITTLIT